MKVLVSGIAVSLAMMASSASAEVILNVDGEDYTLTSLMENCQSMGDDPLAQVACFSAVSKLVEEQTADETANTVSIPDALEALRAVAQYQDSETGLLIAGAECNIRFLYYGNYFHISRRNVSSLDLYTAQFDASGIAIDQTVQAQGGQVSSTRGVMQPGAVASTIGGQAIESAQFGFAAKSASSSIGDYAIEVANQLTPTESSTFDFVVVHPAKSQSSAEIWTAFEAYVAACQG